MTRKLSISAAIKQARRHVSPLCPFGREWNYSFDRFDGKGREWSNPTQYYQAAAARKEALAEWAAHLLWLDRHGEPTDTESRENLTWARREIAESMASTYSRCLPAVLKTIALDDR